MRIARDSVRKQLLLTLLSGLALAWLIGAGVAIYRMQNQVHTLLDDNLRQSAAALLHEVEENAPAHAFSVFKYSSQWVFQVWRDGAQLQIRSKLAPEQRLSDGDAGFSDSMVDGQSWRVFSAWDGSHRYLLQVAQSQSDRRHFLVTIIRQQVESFAIALVLFASMIWLVVDRVLKPVSRLSDAIAQRDASNLSPLLVDVPREIAPLAQRLNQLLLRLSSTLEGERRFTADAAHELRTPLSAIKSQIQVAIAARENPQQQRALAQALQACDIAAHRVEQMLTLARLEQDVWSVGVEAVDLRALLAQAIGEVAALAQAKSVALALHAEEAIVVSLRSDLWRILLRNLLDNAIRYAPDNSLVNVHATRADGCIELSICDEGPGIAPEQLQNAFARFERLGRSEGGGCGLGLSIVARIAELHGAQVELLSGEYGRGLCARVRIQ